MVSYFACLLRSLKSAKTHPCKWLKSGRKISFPGQFWFASIEFWMFSDANCKHSYAKFLASFIIFHVRRIWFGFFSLLWLNCIQEMEVEVYFLTKGSIAVWGDATQPTLQWHLSEICSTQERNISLRLVLQPANTGNHLRGWLHLKATWDHRLVRKDEWANVMTLNLMNEESIFI